MSYTETTTVTTNCHVEWYETRRIRRQVPGWGRLSRKEKCHRLRQLDPNGRHGSHNVTTETLTEYHAEDLNPEASPPSLDATHIALGDDDSDEPQRDNDELNNEIDRLPYTDVLPGEQRFTLIVFIGGGDLNGESILEGGAVDESKDVLLNHAFWSDPEGRLDPKSRKVVANLSIEFSWGDGG